jgi:hypothetical protein
VAEQKIDLSLLGIEAILTVTPAPAFSCTFATLGIDQRNETMTRMKTGDSNANAATSINSWAAGTSEGKASLEAGY